MSVVLQPSNDICFIELKIPLMFMYSYYRITVYNMYMYTQYTYRSAHVAKHSVSS